MPSPEALNPMPEIAMHCLNLDIHLKLREKIAPHKTFRDIRNFSQNKKGLPEPQARVTLSPFSGGNGGGAIIHKHLRICSARDAPFIL